MKPITDSPEWNRFFWAIILITLAVIVFSCEQAPSHSTMMKIEDVSAKYWWLIWSIPCLVFYRLYRKVRNEYKSAFFGLLALFCFCALVMPYLMMLGLKIMLQLF